MYNVQSVLFTVTIEAARSDMFDYESLCSPSTGASGQHVLVQTGSSRIQNP